MADARTGELTTANYGWVKPTVGGSTDAWGGYINTDLDGIDSTVKSVSTVANAAYPTSNPAGYQTAAQVTASLGGYLPLTGGTLSGAVIAIGYTINGAAGSFRQLNFSSGGSGRWSLATDNVAESGSNAGSNFDIVSNTDGGAPLMTALSINRATGTVTQAGAAHVISPGAGAYPTVQLNAAASGVGMYIQGTVANSNRWQLYLGDGSAEGGVATGSNFAISCYNNSNAFIANPLTIARSTGVVTFSSAIVNGPSDRTLKENIEPLQGSLDRVLALQGVSFNMIATPDKPEIGLIAQDVQSIIPEIVQTYDHTVGERSSEPKLALDYPKLAALLIEAVKELSARVAALEAAR